MPALTLLSTLYSFIRLFASIRWMYYVWIFMLTTSQSQIILGRTTITIAVRTRLNSPTMFTPHSVFIGYAIFASCDLDYISLGCVFHQCDKFMDIIYVPQKCIGYQYVCVYKTHSDHL